MTSSLINHRTRALEWGARALGVGGACISGGSAGFPDCGWVTPLAANIVSAEFAGGIGADGLFVRQTGFALAPRFGQVRALQFHWCLVSLML